MTIVEFLNARLDEDEKTAQTADGDGCGLWEAHGHTLDLCQYEVEVHPSSATHIARHDPARVLREVAAKRQIIQHCERLARIQKAEPRGVPDPDLLRSDLVLQQLAAVYQDHPDYRQEWAV